MTWWILWFMGNESTVNWCGLVGLLIYIYIHIYIYIYIYIYKWGASRCSSVASPYSTSIFVYIADSLINPCTRISSLHYMSIVAASTELTELHHFLGSWHRLTHQLPINGCFFFPGNTEPESPWFMVKSMVSPLKFRFNQEKWGKKGISLFSNPEDLGTFFPEFHPEKMMIFQQTNP